MADRGRSGGVSCSSSKSFTAICHSQAFSQAEMAALKQITSGDTCRAASQEFSKHGDETLPVKHRWSLDIFECFLRQPFISIGWSEVEHQQS